MPTFPGGRRVLGDRTGRGLTGVDDAVDDGVATLPAVGSCAGFEVHSRHVFATLRVGSGTPLAVRERSVEPTGELLMTWRPRPGQPFHGRLLATPNGYAFWASDAGWYGINPGRPAITMEPAPAEHQVRRELRLFGVPAALCALERRDISIHAAAVDIAGQAVLLAGPSQFGKTTLAAAFVRAGHRLLAEDTAVCTLRPQAAVFPGPAVIRLRTDVAASLAPAGGSGAVQDGDRLRIILPPAARGTGDGVPLRAILLLRQQASEPSLTAVASATAIRDVYALTFRLPTPDSQASVFGRVADLVLGAECLDLRRPLTIDALPRVVELIEGWIRQS
jgi:hypothetical protein